MPIRCEHDALQSHCPLCEMKHALEAVQKDFGKVRIQPSEKSLEMGMMLEELSSRTSSIHAAKCIPTPFGCGGEIGEFKDELSRREYSISGLCQTCQDNFFGSLEEEELDDGDW